jgi:hypothetical protein
VIVNKGPEAKRKKPAATFGPEPSPLTAKQASPEPLGMAETEALFREQEHRVIGEAANHVQRASASLERAHRIAADSFGDDELARRIIDERKTILLVMLQAYFRDSEKIRCGRNGRSAATSEGVAREARARD